jgi:hypothetical protein
MDCYGERIKEIRNELSEMTLGEFEIKYGINTYDYTGTDFGYQLKTHRPKTRDEAFADIATPEFDELLKLADEL